MIKGSVMCELHSSRVFSAFCFCAMMAENRARQDRISLKALTHVER